MMVASARCHIGCVEPVNNQVLTTYSYHDFLSTPSIVELWEKRGQTVNSRNTHRTAYIE